ncbi:MAG: c-type cytochrome, partial [Planctomycetales bacterium]
RHARRLLQERAAAASQTRSGRAAPRDAPVTPAQQEAARRLHALFKERQEPPVRLRALWALYGIGALEESFLRALLEDENESICAWAVRLLCDQGQPSAAALEQFERLSATVQSPLVRLHLASNLQRLSAPARWPIAEALALREEDADDPNLPLMIWYGVEPLVEDDPARFLRLAGQTRIPLLARHVCRRVVSIPDAASGLAGFVELLATVPAARQAELLAGALEGLEGRRRVSPPAAWSRVHELLQGSDDEAVRERGLQLALIFNDPRALAALRAIALDADASPDPRNRALQSLVASQADEVAPLLLELVDDPATRQVAIRGLAAFNHPATQTHLLERYLRFDPPARLDILQTLASRAPWSMALLDAVETGKIPRSDLTAYTARQMNSLGDPRLKARVLALWGELRTSPGDKTRLIARYKARLTAESLQQGNRSQGRAVFQKLCANCHRLFDAGGTIGPDLTGAQRTSLDYLLQTLVDPSAAVARDYQMQIIETTGGRTITGLIVDESPAAITLQTVNERMVVLKSDIENQAASPASMMPEGMLSQLSNDQIRDLLAYLMGPEQAPLSEPREQP